MTSAAAVLPGWLSSERTCTQHGSHERLCPVLVGSSLQYRIKYYFYNSDARDRIEHILESLVALSAITDTEANEFALANLLSVLRQLDKVDLKRGR